MAADLLPGGEVYCAICHRWIPPHDPEGWTVLVREASFDAVHWTCIEGHRENWGLTDGTLSSGVPGMDAAVPPVQGPAAVDIVADEIC